MMDRDCQRSDGQYNAQSYAGKQGQFADALRDARIEGVECAASIAAVNSYDNHGYADNGVKAHLDGDGHHERNERNGFFRHAVGCAADTEYQHDDSDKPVFFSAQPLDQSVQSCGDRSCTGDDSECAAADEHECNQIGRLDDRVIKRS